MDYPLSRAAELGLYNGKFTDGVPGVSQASVNPSQTMNTLIDEVLNVLAEAGIAPNEAKSDQLRDAIKVVMRKGAGLYAADTGAANALVVALTPAPTAYSAGMLVRVKVAATNTGAATINVNGLGAVPIGHGDGSALQPGDLTAGQIADFRHDGAKFQVVPETGRLINVQVFTANSIYTPTPGMKTAIVKAVSGGGAGGGTAATTASTYAAAGGGASGSYGEGRYTAAQIGASQPITIGVGGVPGAPGAPGGPGGTTSFGTLLSCPGGGGAPAGGSAPAPFSSGFGAVGSAPTGANVVSAPGAPGGVAVVLGSGGALSGPGGGSPLLGGGGNGPASPAATNGAAATGYGAGGSGACTSLNDVARAGGAGKSGIIIVLEYA